MSEQGPPRFDPQSANSDDTQNLPSQPPLPGGDNEITGYQPTVNPPQNPPPPTPPPAPQSAPPQVPKIETFPPPAGRPSTPIRGIAPDPEPEEVVEVSALPLVLAIGALLAAAVAVLISMGILDIGQNSQLISSSRLASGSVGETQISNESITLDKLQPGLVEELRGTEGPAGPRGPAGKAGKRGPAGEGLVGLEQISRTASGTQSASATATCGQGRVALSGGASISTSNGKVILTASEPTSSESGWLARAVAIAPKPGNWELTSYAWCADDPR